MTKITDLKLKETIMYSLDGNIAKYAIVIGIIKDTKRVFIQNIDDRKELIISVNKITYHPTNQ